MTSEHRDRYLIVNADDFGYFRCVSTGIIESATRGIVTATGVIANRPGLEEQAEELKTCHPLDTGVHLNLTVGKPLTAAMRAKCLGWAGSFPGKYPMVLAILSGGIQAADVASEWRAQIERCLAAGLVPRFLNSHEHIHMLPSLFGITIALAGQYGIPHVRFTTAEPARTIRVGTLLRNGILRGLQVMSGRKASTAKARFLGLGPSGRLDLDYFRRTLPSMELGTVYELMCHPGRLDSNEVKDPRLLSYHDWHGELATLTSPTLKALLVQNCVSVIGYRDLDVVDGDLVVRTRESVPAAFSGPTR